MNRFSLALGLLVCMQNIASIRAEDSFVAATVGDTSVKFSAKAGANLFSIKHKGVELLAQPEDFSKMSGFRFGTPILYPTPNRVRNAEFNWEGKTYKFPPNDGSNFLHGLVHSVPWKLVSHEFASDKALILCELPFEPGKTWYELFPFPHVLRLAIEVRDGSVQWTFTVDNSKGKASIPMGLALHPWFMYQGSRQGTVLTVPARTWMEAEKMLPTGKLVPVKGSKFDARKGVSLEGFVIDDVYRGLKSGKPATIEFRDKGIKIALRASDDFTHLVVYTPADKPWFCVENQTCSTDAHNLFGKGLKDESHLLVVRAGETHSCWVQFEFSQK